MNRDEAVSLVALQLGNRTDLDATILTVMRHVQQTILEQAGTFCPWFLLTEPSSATLSASTNRIAIPTDFIIEDEDWGLAYTDEDGDLVFLDKDEFDVMTARWKGTTAIPKKYALDGSYFYTFPTYDQDLTVTMRYYAHDVDLSTGNITNQWLTYAADLLIAETGYYLAAKVLQNSALAGVFKTDAGVARSRVLVMHEARMHVNRRYSMGDN